MNAKPGNNLFVTTLLIVTLAFVGCSKSDSGPATSPGDGGTTLTSMVAVGAMAKGSVKVNGVEFSTSPSTTIIADDNPKPETFLDDGMTVKVKGTVNADGITGTAQQVAVVNEVRGPISAPPGTDTVTVHGQTVLIDGGTVLAGGVTGTASLAQNDNIEVHGGRDDTGMIHATRVEKLAAGTVADDVRGAVSGLQGSQFTIGGTGGSLTITFNGSTVIVPDTATTANIVNGAVVEVQLGNGNVATKITVEDLDHPEFEAAEGQERSFEGLLSGFTSTTSGFKVGTQDVQLDTNASIDGGMLADLINGIKVEAEGHVITGGVLLAEKITIKDNIRIEANAEAPGSASVLGRTVTFTSGTRPAGLASGATITTGDGLRIRGFINRDGTTITATRIDKVNAVAPNKVIVQGPVKNIDGTGHTFTIMGITISTDNNTIARPNDDRSADNTQTIPLADFFSSLTADRTIVKAKGSFSGSTLTATEIELE